MDSDIKYIQNTLWAMWKEFCADFDVKNWTNQASALCERYKNSPLLYSYCQNQAITWTPVINQTAEDHRKEVA